MPAKSTSAEKTKNGRLPIGIMIVLGVLLAAITLIAFGQTLGNDFITYYDDGEYVVKNSRVQEGFTPDAIRWAFTAFHSANWHPLTWISHMLDCRLFGLDPMGHHLTNVLFHVANTLLLFLVLSILTGYVWRSAFVAALFAIHPIHVESVAWVAERKDVLSTFFWLLTMLAYLYYTARPGIGRYLLVAGGFALGLMSKPMLVTLPIVLLILDYWPMGRLRLIREPKKQWSGWGVLAEKTPLFAMSAGSCIVTYLAQKAGGAVSSFEVFSIGVRTANALVAYLSYILKMLWPVNLTVIYPHPADGLQMWLVAGSILLLLGITAAAIMLRQRAPYLLAGWLWYVITLVPVIGLVQVGVQAMADRYTYVPSIGFFIMLAWGIPALVNKANRLIVPAVLVTLVLTGLTWRQVQLWDNMVTLFTHAVEVTTDNYAAHNSLGSYWFENGDMERAEEEFSKAISINPYHPGAQANMANVLQARGDYEEALELSDVAVRATPNAMEVHYNRGIILERKGDFDGAIEAYREAIRLKPDFVGAHNNLAIVYFLTGEFEAAWQEVYECRKHNHEPHYGFIQALSEKLPDPGG